MSQSSELPHWVSYLQALAVPVIALVGVWIAARQMLIADEKLKLEAFDRQYERRVATYEATRDFLASIFLDDLSPDDIRAYGLCTLDAQFLFDEDFHIFLKEILSRAAQWKEASISLEQEPHSENRRAYEKIRNDNLDWIIRQGDPHTGFARKFAPFLVYTKPKRVWFLRWP